MLSFLKRACLHPFDYTPSLRRHTLRFKEKVDEGNGTYSFLFTPPLGLQWLAGQHGVFRLSHHAVNGKTWRAFSVASSVAEGEVRIGTTIPPKPSSFKQALLSLEPGAEISINGPFGEFHTTSQTKQIVGIAGGIGITPFRSIAYEIAHNLNRDTKLTLIYAGKNDYFAYRDELLTFADHPHLTLILVDTPEEVTAAIKTQTTIFQNQAHYYISGSPGMITGITKTLKDNNIKKIVNDPFQGY